MFFFLQLSLSQIFLMEGGKVLNISVLLVPLAACEIAL